MKTENEIDMRRVFFITIILISVLAINAQTTKTFDCGLLSFEYPSNFKNIPIQQAPHMILKLESQDYFFSISCWEKGYGDDVTAWNDEVYEMYKQFSVENGILISISKESLPTKGGNVKCLKVLYNINKNVQGHELKMKNASYIVINNGYLYVFNFASDGEYHKNSNTTYTDNLLKGLKLKTSAPKGLDYDEDYLMVVVNSLNAQCPFDVDECTIIDRVMLSGTTVILKTIIFDACDPYIDYDEFKSRMCTNFSLALDKAFIEYLQKMEHNIIYLVYNENNEYKTRVTITPQDVLEYYKK